MNIYNGLSIEETIKLAKNDKKAKKALYDYYKNYYIEKCIKYNGKEYKAIAQKIYDEVFNYYFNNNLTSRLYDYLDGKAEYLRSEALINNLNIAELTLLGKINDNAKKKLYDYYKDFYIKKCIKYNGKEGYGAALKTYEKVFYDYFKKDMVKSLAFYLKYKSKVAKQERIKDKIEEDKKEVIKYYADDLYNKMPKEKVLNNEEIYDLCYNFIRKIVVNYNKEMVKSNIYTICHMRIKRLVNYAKDEENLVLYYVKYVGLNKKALNYFKDKYEELKKEYNVSNKEYKNAIIKVLSNGKLLRKDIYASIKRELEYISKNNNNAKKDEVDKIVEKINNKIMPSMEEIDILKEYYSPIKDDIYDKYKDKVTIGKKELKEEISVRYDSLINKYISNVFNDGMTDRIDKYVRCCLYSVFNSKKYYYPKYKDSVPLEIREDRKRVHKKILYKYIEKYNCNFTDEEMEEILQEYNNISDLYYIKPRKAKYEDYIKSNVREMIKNKKHK